MTQKQKLDIILKKLFDYRHDKQAKFFEPLLKDLGIYESEADAGRLAEVLKNEGLAKVHLFSGGRIEIKISPKGMEYCEETSHTKPGTPLILLTVTGNNNQTVVAGRDASKVNMSQSNTQAQELIESLRKAIEESGDISIRQKQTALECLEDIENDLTSGKSVKKFKWDSLLTNTASGAQIVSLATQLSQLFGYLPSL